MNYLLKTISAGFQISARPELVPVIIVSQNYQAPGCLLGPIWYISKETKVVVKWLNIVKLE